MPPDFFRYHPDKKMEENLRQAQRMETLGTLAGGIAHDFNNILTSVVGFSQLAMAAAKPESKQYERLKEIFKAGLRASDLVQQILTFARKSEREIKPVQISPLLKEIIKFLRSTLPASIEINQDIKTGQRTLADPSQIHQIIVNLATNAAEVMRENGGKLFLGLEEKFLEKNLPGQAGPVPGNYIQLTVMDTGPGLPEETVENIYDPCLSATHGLVRELKGAIQVISNPGQGTRFDVYFPAVPAEETRTLAGHLETLTGDERILAVDDEASILNFIRDTIQLLPLLAVCFSAIIWTFVR
jgi:signal transduction histidine kinase